MLAGSGCFFEPSGAGEKKPSLRSEAKPEATESCPKQVLRPQRAPEVSPRHRALKTWLSKLDAPASGDAILLDPQAVEALNRRNRSHPEGFRDLEDPGVVDEATTQRELEERVRWLSERVASGEFREGAPGSFQAALERVRNSRALAEPTRHLIHREAALYCLPSTEGLYTDPPDLDFDRNRCSGLHPGEAGIVSRRSPDGQWLYFRSAHSVGWLQPEVLSPALSPEAFHDYLRHRPRVYRLEEDLDHEPTLRSGSCFPLLREDGEEASVRIPSSEAPGFRSLELPSDDARWHLGPLPFTRKVVWKMALAALDQPYGWGGTGGHRDCSRFLYDLFSLFDIELARNSAQQSGLGSRTLELEGLSEQGKRERIQEAARAGIVLLYMPGHIMLYLGEDGGRLYAVSSLSEYLVPCPGGPDTVHRLDRVAVTTLDLGRGTKRRSFIERLTRLTVFGTPP